MHFVAACVLMGRMCAGVLGCIEALRGTIQAEQRAATTFLLVLFRRILLPMQASILMVQVRSPAALVVMHWEIRTALRWLQLQLPIASQVWQHRAPHHTHDSFYAAHLRLVSHHSGIACPADEQCTRMLMLTRCT